MQQTDEGADGKERNNKTNHYEEPSHTHRLRNVPRHHRGARRHRVGGVRRHAHDPQWVGGLEQPAAERKRGPEHAQLERIIGLSADRQVRQCHPEWGASDRAAPGRHGPRSRHRARTDHSDQPRVGFLRRHHLPRQEDGWPSDSRPDPSFRDALRYLGLTGRCKRSWSRRRIHRGAYPGSNCSGKESGHSCGRAWPPGFRHLPPVSPAGGLNRGSITPPGTI